MSENKLGDVKSSNLPSKVKRLTKRKKGIKEDIIKPILKKYNPLVSVVLLILMIVLVAITPDAVLPDLIIILKGVVQLLTLVV